MNVAPCVFVVTAQTLSAKLSLLVPLSRGIFEKKKDVGLIRCKCFWSRMASLCSGRAVCIALFHASCLNCFLSVLTKPSFGKRRCFDLHINPPTSLFQTSSEKLPWHYGGFQPLFPDLCSMGMPAEAVRTFRPFVGRKRITPERSRISNSSCSMFYIILSKPQKESIRVSRNSKQLTMHRAEAMRSWSRGWRILSLIILWTHVRLR